LITKNTKIKRSRRFKRDRRRAKRPTGDGVLSWKWEYLGSRNKNNIAKLIGYDYYLGKELKRS
jgi:hypothetical protein